MDGSDLGHFSLLEKIGEGGMGRVYKARDTRLGRLVAIKLLDEERYSDTARRGRFFQEAKAASALNHPNIITIHEIGEQEGRIFIVMELIDGKPLNELIPRRGMRLSDTLRIAAQVADALSAAHAARIVHRDLKPANIMVDGHGRVKVLDFGLAKRTIPTPVTDESTHTAIDETITEAGVILGSIPYMSPEQAEGKSVDARSDIFSFGSVLYEMITGQRAFRGESRISTLAAIVGNDPQPVNQICCTTPPELERLIMRCLRKDLMRRAQHIADVKLALEELKEETESGRVVSATRNPVRSRRWMVLGGAVLSAFSILLFVFWPDWRENQAPLTEVPLTSYPGYQDEPALSPDGSQFAFVWDGGQENALPQLYVSVVGRGTPLRLTNTAGSEARYPAWSPDGQTIAFVRNSKDNDRGELTLIPALAARSGDLTMQWAVRPGHRMESGSTSRQSYRHNPATSL
jgi:serine/threonine protein kinase